MVLGFVLSILSVVAGELVAGRSINKCMIQYHDELKRVIPAGVVPADLDPKGAPEVWIQRATIRAALLPALCLTLIGFYEIDFPFARDYMGAFAVILGVALAIVIWKFGEVDSDSWWATWRIKELSAPTVVLVIVNIGLLVAASVWH